MQIIKNESAIARTDAITKDRRTVLLYKLRICDYCKESFDIEKKGVFYWCGCERDERN